MVHPEREVRCSLRPMGVTAGGGGAQKLALGRAQSEVSKGCLSEKHWPMHIGLCLTKGVLLEQAEHV